MKPKNFNTLSYLQSRNIQYSHSGDNVSSGWVGTQCLFCIDHKNHLGINIQTGNFNCFKCGETGSAVKLITTIDGVSFKEAYKIIEQFGGGTYVPKEKVYQSKVVLPVGASKNFSDLHLSFLQKRRYPKDVIEKYDLYATGPIGNHYKYRIIIPVYMNKRMMCFVGRDVTGKSDSPYWNSSPDFSIRDVKQCLYGMDNVLRNTVVIVEGILDAWRIGDGAVCTFGTLYTHQQLLLLRGMRRVFVLYDSDAIAQAHKLGHDLSSIVKQVEILELGSGDPDDLSDDDVRTLRKELNL